MTCRLLVLHRAHRQLRQTSGLLDALEAEGATLWDADATGLHWVGRRARDEGYEAVVVFLAYKHLVARPAIEWRGFTGLRLMLEQDASMNYSTGSPYRGTWPREFRRHRFDLLVVTGREVARRLAADGVAAVWMPKGIDPGVFWDQRLSRHGVCTYGALWASRRAMRRRLRRESIPVTQLSLPFAELGRRLNEHLACIVCNLDGHEPASDTLLVRAVRRALGFEVTRLSPGIEPMGKNFEAAAAGCAVVADRIAELTDLGFIDGRTVIEYDDLDTLVDKLRHYQTRPDDLRRIGGAAAALCRERHTWRHRARLLRTIIERTLTASTLALAPVGDVE